MSKLIPLSGKRGQGKFVIVDDTDYEWLSQYKWYLLSSGGYASRYVGYVEGKTLSMLMHRE